MKAIKSHNSFTCFDFETTGLSVHTAEIIEIGAVKVRNWQIVERFSTFVKPSSPISASITRLTGISNNDVENSPTIYEVIPEFIKFIDSDILLGHNISRYDLPILRRIASELFSIDNEYQDTLQLSRAIIPDLPSHNLETLCNYYGIKNVAAHRAVGDAEATAEIYQCIMLGKKGQIDKVKKKNNVSHSRSAFSQQTQALITLKGILTGMTCDNVLSNEEVFYLKKWLDDNSNLEGNYPFDIVFTEVNNALADGILEQHELEHMLIIFKEFLNPIETKTANSNCIDFSNKTVCLSGEFETGSKNEIGDRLISYGAIISQSVTKSVDFLVVGEKGSGQWYCGNYGTKIKKALEMQNQGHHIQILRECEVFNIQEEVESV